MTKDLRFALAIAAVGLVLTNVFAMMGLAAPLPRTLHAIWTNDAVVIVVGMMLGPVFLMHLLTIRSWRSVVLLCASGAVLALVLWLIDSSRTQHDMTVLRAVNLPIAGFGLASLVWLLFHAQFSKGAEAGSARHLLLVAVFIALMVLGIGDVLQVAAAFQPKTLDFVTYRVDAALGFEPSAELARWVNTTPWMEKLLSGAYAAIAFAFPVLYGLQLRAAGQSSVSVLRLWVVGMLLAYATYLLYPITGPYYAFGAKLFPSAMPELTQIPLHSAVVSLAPRNGMPSMHFGWALLFWMNVGLVDRGPLRSVLRPIAAAFVVLTGFATIGLGEHYLIDLVVAVPFVIGLQALCSPGIAWSSPGRRNAAVYGLGMAYLWIAALRVAPVYFVEIPGLLWMTVLVTLALSIGLYRALASECLRVRAESAVLLADRANGSPRQSESGASSINRRVMAMFVISGIAGIMYEVLFSKALALTFGSTATATYTVLATYMGGMAIGSWLGGRIATIRSHPLLVYACCELAVGIYCAVTPAIFGGIQHIYVSMATGIAPDAAVLTWLRIALGVAALLAPTIAMGMTLPILARFLSNENDSLGRPVAALYAANTFGAAVGALLAGYIVLPVLGVYRTTLLASAMNLIAALLAIEVLKFVLSRAPSEHARAKVTEDAQENGPLDVNARPAATLGRLALLVLGVGGIVTLAIEIKYMHLLAVVAGNSTYAFSLMLFTFLIGLGCGAEIARRLLQRSISLPVLLGVLEFTLAFVILCGVFLWDVMPSYFGNFHIYPSLPSFASKEFARGIVCWMAMFPPALVIGALYPIAMECIGRAHPVNRFRALGMAASLNTVGNIAGVLIGGFVLLPHFGALRSVQILAVLCVAIGVIAMWRAGRESGALRWVAAVPAIAMLVVQPASFDYDRLASGANVYFQAQSWGKIIDHAESIDGGLTSVSLSDTASPVRTLLTNGKFQGNDSLGGEMQAQVGFALAPLLHTEKRDRALVIGYGTGVSTRTLHAAEFKELDVVDLSADIIRLANKHFSRINDKVTEQPGVNTFITDGRNFLMLQDHRYDVIGMEITSIWFAGAASLYNRDFYQLVKRRLNAGGVLQQWMQLHHITNHDVLTILASVRAEFRYVWLYLIGGQGIIVASDDASAQPSADRVRLIESTKRLQPLLATLTDGPESLLKAKLLEPEDTDRLVNSIGVPIQYLASSDDNLWLEYSTPKGNVLNTSQSFSANLNFIRRFSHAPANAKLDGEEGKDG